MKKTIALIFLGLMVHNACAQTGFIESTVFDNRTGVLTQSDLALNVQLQSGPGGYDYQTFYSNCSTTTPTARGVSYIIVPKSIDIGGVQILINWSNNILGDIDGKWLIIGQYFTTYGGCNNMGMGGRLTSSTSISASGTASLQELPPGSYSVSIPFYTGSSFSTSDAEALAMTKEHALEGPATATPYTPFNGVAACAQADAANGANIDFGTITSNGQLQQGPLTSLTLACNYDLSLNDVTYSLKSNNPVAGQPASGDSVAVQLSNSAIVHLGGEELKQSAPNKISLDISPIIDTETATPGEGTGSAILTFTYN